MKHLKELAAAVICSLAVGCAAKRHHGPRVDLVVPISCLKKPVIMKGCDPENYSDCEKAAVNYYKSCAMVTATHR